MIRRAIGYFDSRAMGVKLTAAFFAVILIPMALLAYISYRVLDSHIREDLRDRISMGLKVAWREYYVRAEQMRYGMLQAGAMEEIKGSIARRDKGYLREMMLRWKQMRPYVDVWAVVDRDGRVIARLNGDSSGDVMALNGTVESAIALGEPVVSTEVLSRERLRAEGLVLEEAFKHDGSARHAGLEEAHPEEAMALVVVTPVYGFGNNVIGAIVTGDVLNADPYIPEAIYTKIPGLFTTISLKGVRVSTNLSDGGGRHLRNTRLDPDVVAELGSGKTSYREWDLPGVSYMSVFEPIKDSKGRTIGAIDVGVTKERLWHIQRENGKVIAMVALMGLAMSLIVAAVSTYRITRPLKVLTDKISSFGRGDLTARVTVTGDPDAKDEIRILARTFNSMMDEVSMREEEKAESLREIEEKNRALTRLNDELRAANEEIEVAYEETQSQTEELHAINEELKLLNEDLDRKNTELKAANRIISMEEEEIKRAKDKLRLIYDSIRDYVLLVDQDLKVLEANRHLVEALGADWAQVIGRNIYGLFGMREPADCPVRKSIGSSAPIEKELAAPGGKVFYFHSFPMAGDGPGSAVVYIRDVTEKRMLMQQLVQSDKLSSLGELVSGVAHELNNPLTGIMCFSELLLGDGLGEGANAKLRKINDASHRCKKIIDNLLTFSRWRKPEKTFEDVNRLIRESVDLRAYQFRVDNIAVDLGLEEGLPSTMVDVCQIQQVFLNLINNARDAMAEAGGGGTLTISSALVDGRIVVRFTDTGKGMPEDVVKRVFDPFFTTKEVGKGTGLGLSISYGIIKEHGGSISAESRPGAGSTFIVELPVVEEPVAGGMEAAVAAPPRLKGEGRRALIVDDEEIITDLLMEALSSAGFSVESASTGDEALGMLAGKDYDIIISDIKMPGLDGKALWEMLRSIKPGSTRKVVFITGDSVNKDTQAFLEEAGALYLKKPFTVEDLKEAVSRLIEASM